VAFRVSGISQRITTMTAHRDKLDLYERVTAEIIGALEAGTRPWAPTWTSSLSPPGLPLRIKGEPYRGINVLLLWSVMITRGYPSPVWMTYAQARKLGGQVRRGEHGTLVCYAGATTKGDSGPGDRRSGQGGSGQGGSGELNASVVPKLRSSSTADRNEGDRLIHFLKSYIVFNVAQIEGLPERFDIEAVSATVGLAEAVEFFIANTKARIIAGPNPLYRHGTDTIECPPQTDFRDPEDHAAAICHELLHWTGIASRLNRDMGKRYGDEAYGMEELVAEIGAAMLCASFGIGAGVREENAAYIATWLKRLKQDKRAIFTAARLAQNAVDYLQGLQPDASEPTASDATHMDDPLSADKAIRSRSQRDGAIAASVLESAS
jgi:antirestriction protein ArdC